MWIALHAHVTCCTTEEWPAGLSNLIRRRPHDSFPGRQRLEMPDEHGRIDADSIKAATGQFDLESIFKLTMSHMGIRTIENLSMCPNLTVCSRCCASRLPHPWHRARTHWQELDFSSNDISRITGLSELKQLKKISLAGNELTKIDGLDGLHLLETVQLQGNKLTQLDDAQKLAKLPCLRTLRLHDNPMCEHPAYLSAVRRMLPNLRSLDGEFSALADAAAVEGDALAEMELPAPEPWLKGFTFDTGETGAELAGTEDFQKVVTDCKRLSARAQSLLADCNDV